MKKYEFTGETKAGTEGVILHRIRALVKIELGDITVEAGDIGGWIEKEENLSQYDKSWVYGSAWVCGDAWVYGDARVYGSAWVCGDAKVCGDADICELSHYLVVGPIGSRNGFTTFFRCKNSIKVKCGCFLGTTEEFLEKVKTTHGESKHAIAYQKATDLAIAQISLSSEDD